MPYTLDKLKEIRNRLNDGDVLGARKPLNELIEKYELMFRMAGIAVETYEAQHPLLETENGAETIS